MLKLEYHLHAPAFSEKFILSVKTVKNRCLFIMAYLTLDLEDGR
jgi:hypothetical protein